MRGAGGGGRCLSGGCESIKHYCALTQLPWSGLSSLECSLTSAQELIGIWRTWQANIVADANLVFDYRKELFGGKGRSFYVSPYHSLTSVSVTQLSLLQLSCES